MNSGNNRTKLSYGNICPAIFFPKSYIKIIFSDFNECNGITECDEVSSYCINTVGNYYCQCKPGFELSRVNNRTCEDIDECKVGAALCSQKHNCKNTFGSYTCGCDEGYRLNADGRTCEGKACLGFQFALFMVHEIQIYIFLLGYLSEKYVKIP